MVAPFFINSIFFITEEKTENSYEITVNVAELLGNEYYIHTDFGDKDLIVKIPVTRIISAKEVLNVEMKVDKIHFFDPETEMVI